MIILSFETSCDDTGVSILEVKNLKFKVLADCLSSQAHLHAEYGGVFPSLAKREHIKNLPILYEKALQIAKISARDVDIICVTSGPGLEPALWTGITFASGLAKELGVPLVPVNHMEGHVLSVFGHNQGEFKIPNIKLPAISLLVSGGHTELVLSRDWPASTSTKQGGHKYKIIGETLDDAVGEAFDKVARMLGLPYPGGPEIEKLANECKSSSDYIKLPRPMMHSKDFNFSFSGLKTAVLYLIRDLKEKDPNILQNKQTVCAIAKEFQDSASEVLIHKTKKAIEKYKAQTLIVGGGVANSQRLRQEIKENIKNVDVLFPGQGLSSDNAVMIALAGYFKYKKNPDKFSYKTRVRADGNLKLK